MKSLEEAMQRRDAPFYPRRVKEALVTFPDPETGKVKALFTKRIVKTSEFAIGDDEYPISFRMNVPCFHRAISAVEERFQLQRISVNWERWRDPYYFSFRHFLDNFHDNLESLAPDIVPLAEKVDFYFDRRSEQVKILEAWSVVRADMTEDFESKFGKNPRFENKQDFLGLQAADFWAWWVRSSFSANAAYTCSIDGSAQLRDDERASCAPCPLMKSTPRFRRSSLATMIGAL